MLACEIGFLLVVEVLVISWTMAQASLFVRRKLAHSWGYKLSIRLRHRLLLIEVIINAQILKLLVNVELILSKLILLGIRAELVDWLLGTLHLLHPAQRV